MARAVEVPQLRRFASDSGGVEMEMEGKIYTVWGAQGPPKVFCAKSARWFNSKRGKSPVRPLAVFGQSSWVNREVYTYSKVFTHLMNDTMKPLDHQPLSKPILYPIPWQLSTQKATWRFFVQRSLDLF